MQVLSLEQKDTVTLATGSCIIKPLINPIQMFSLIWKSSWTVVERWLLNNS